MEEELTNEEFWDQRYGGHGHGHIWSGNPNAALVEEVSGLTPGTALDLGCGEGADAVWLARQGWKVTAVDVSGVAIGRAVEHAEDAGLAEAIDFQRRDLSESFPDGVFDLVTTQFLHSPSEPISERILRSARDAVAPGGTLLVEGHAGPPPWEPDSPYVLPTAAEVVVTLDLDADEWEVLRAEEHDRAQAAPDGTVMTRLDCTVKARRRPTL
ncbi:class I SAM-dependent methyltransferase [Actinomadura rupiterrae]|uniref:class I SAM-dependent methyltransferase n=1 Tax=Actinomadura rupiterrae TaxID=559627 RepID=UPI0020A5EA3E|nr:class I SAM-dependent methyltransferase [Actinomadura rupiterrae]MCP2335981.1 SAM-dependent methyltransferase [Actinomadura rupiterrae]